MSALSPDQEALFQRVVGAAMLTFTGPECGWRKSRLQPWGHALTPIILWLDEEGWPIGRTKSRMDLEHETAIFMRYAGQKILEQSRAGKDEGRAAKSYDAFVKLLAV